MHVLFVEPRFPSNQRQFARALAAVGARVTGIGEAPLDHLDPELRGLALRLRAGAFGGRRGRSARRGAPGPAARVGRPAGGHGRGAHPPHRTGARGGRHPRHLRAHRLPLPRQAGDEGGAARRRHPHRPVGRLLARAPSCGPSPRRPASRSSSSRATPPAPPARSGSTARTSSTAPSSAGGLERGGSVAAEEFIEGHEGFCDTLAIGGEPVHEFISHYYPNVLEAMRTRWISPQVGGDQPHRRAGLRRAARDGAQGDPRPRHRHLGHPHGVVLRPERPQVLRDRLPSAGRRGLGPLLRRQRVRPLPRVGAWRSSTAARRRRRPAATPPA